MKSEDHSWGPAPKKEEVEGVASELLALGKEINHERLHGFIEEVVRRASSPQVPSS